MLSSKNARKLVHALLDAWTAHLDATAGLGRAREALQQIARTKPYLQIEIAAAEVDVRSSEAALDATINKYEAARDAVLEAMGVGDTSEDPMSDANDQCLFFDARGNAHAHHLSSRSDAARAAAGEDLRAAIAADKARAVEAARPTPDEARRLVDAFGSAVDRLAGFADDPPANRDHYNTKMDRLIADHKAARAALLRAMGVES